MERDNRILVGAVLVIIVIMVSFNFNSFTGSTVMVGSTDIVVSPKVVSPGSQIFVNVNPGNGGVNEKASFFNAEDNLRKGSSYDICGDSYICLEETTFSYIIPTNWESGVYYVKVYDYSINDFVKKEFIVTS